MSEVKKMEEKEKKNIAVAAPFTTYAGYGQYGRAVALMLTEYYKNRQDVQLKLFDIGKMQFSDLERYDLQRSKYKDIIPYMKPIEDLDKEFFDIFIILSIPQAFQQKGLHNIGITALAQTDKVHPILVDTCNRMDQVLVMSDFNIQALKRSTFRLDENKQVKLEIPVDKIGVPYIKPIISDTKTQVSQYIDSIPQKYLFLTVGQWLPGSIGNDRKDIGALISTFLKGFANNQDVGLLLKANHGRSNILSQYSIRQRIGQIERGLGLEITHPNIYFISGNLTEQQMTQIYTHEKVKTYVTFTHGQSLGIPILEFIGTTGKPTLIPYHSGITQYIKPQYSEILIHKQTQVPRQLFKSFMRQYIIPQSRWGTVDYQYALYKMGQVVNNYSQFFDKAAKQREHILQNYSQQILQKKLGMLIDQRLSGDDDEQWL